MDLLDNAVLVGYLYFPVLVGGNFAVLVGYLYFPVLDEGNFAVFVGYLYSPVVSCSFLF